MPLFLFSVLFGLSMDYHVFLLSRIRELYHETRDTTDSVELRRGVDRMDYHLSGARSLSRRSPGFARGDLIMFQQMGFGVAVALLHRRDGHPVGGPAERDELLGELELVPAAVAGLDAAPGGRGALGCAGARPPRASPRGWYRRRVRCAVARAA